jgi:hypothetical protein
MAEIIDIDASAALDSVPTATNVTMDDFLDSLCSAPDDFQTATSQAMNRALSQIPITGALTLFAPAIVLTAQTLEDFSAFPDLAKQYFSFRILHQFLNSCSLYGPDATRLKVILVDMLAVLLEGEGELSPMKYCRLRHLAKRHSLVVEAYVNSLRAASVHEDFLDIRIMRKTIEAGVSDKEAVYLQALGNDFMVWMEYMGMVLA